MSIGCRWYVGVGGRWDGNSGASVRSAMMPPRHVAQQVLSTSRMHQVRPLERGLGLRVDLSHVRGPARRGDWPVRDVFPRVDVSRMQKGVAVPERARGSRFESMLVMERGGRRSIEMLRECGIKRDIGLCPCVNGGGPLNSRGSGCATASLMSSLALTRAKKSARSSGWVMSTPAMKSSVVLVELMSAWFVLSMVGPLG